MNRIEALTAAATAHAAKTAALVAYRAELARIEKKYPQ